MASYGTKDAETFESAMATLQPYLDQIAKLVGEPVELSRVTTARGRYEPITQVGQFKVCDDEPRYPYSFFGVRTQQAYSRDDGYGVKLVQKLVTRWKLVPFPGCCAFCISTEVNVLPPYHRKGVNTVAIQLRQQLARLTGFTGIVCTDIDSNEPERRTLAKAGWKDVYNLTNRRTTNGVNLSVKHLY